MRHEFSITATDAGRRLDRWMQWAFPDAGFALVRRLLRQKKVRLNDRRAQPHDLLTAGDTIVVHAPSSVHARSVSAPSTSDSGSYRGPEIEVLAEHEDFVFLAKPSGVSCSDDGQDPAALARWLHEYFAAGIAAGTQRPEPCHRLDRGTTGVVAVALTAGAQESFRRAQIEKQVQKTYEVAVWGTPPERRWTCSVPLTRRDRARANEPRVIADASGGQRGQSAISHFEALSSVGDRSLLKVTLETGRTHQIRAHCLIQGFAVIHDPRYGRDDDSHPDGPMLHARRLHLRLEGDELEATAAWPEDRQGWLRQWGLVVG